jgi:hypothetical protein
LALTLLASVAACSARPAPAPPPVQGATLGERLAREAATRPAGALRAERVANALAAGGLPVAPLKQVLARTVGARYCAATHTDAGLGVAVCEFASEADAARGLAYSRETFDRLVPGRRLARNGSTLLTLTRAAPGARLDAEAARAAAIFVAMQPTNT